MISNNVYSIVFVSLGSNIQPKNNLTEAVRLLRSKTDVLATSSAYVTAPQGFADQADFFNMAVQLQTPLEPTPLKKDVLDWIEAKFGRQRDPQNKNAPRTIDLDISLWDDAVFAYGEKPWRVPDPDIVRFAHVVIPLTEIAPEYVHPVENVPLGAIAARFAAVKFQRLPFPFDA